MPASATSFSRSLRLSAGQPADHVWPRARRRPPGESVHPSVRPTSCSLTVARHSSSGRPNICALAVAELEDPRIAAPASRLGLSRGRRRNSRLVRAKIDELLNQSCLLFGCLAALCGPKRGAASSLRWAVAHRRERCWRASDVDDEHDIEGAAARSSPLAARRFQ